MADNVYIVAQCPEARARIGGVLRGQPFDVSSYESAQAFLDGVARDACGCVVIPADLPDAGARAVIDGVRARKLCLAVVIVGCDDDLRVAVDFIRSGASEFVEHPMRAGQLVSSVRRALAAAHVAYAHCR